MLIDREAEKDKRADRVRRYQQLNRRDHGDTGRNSGNEEYREPLIEARRRTDAALFNQQMRDMMLGEKEESPFWEAEPIQQPDWKALAENGADENYQPVMTRTGQPPKRVEEHLDGTYGRSVPEDDRLISRKQGPRHNRTGVTDLIAPA